MRAASSRHSFGAATRNMPSMGIKKRRASRRRQIKHQAGQASRAGRIPTARRVPRALGPRPRAGSAEPCPQPWQDQLLVTGDRRFLVVPGEVEDQVVEPVVDVRRDLFDVLLGVG